MRSQVNSKPEFQRNLGESASYAIKCDDCKKEIGRTYDVRKSYEGGQCSDCALPQAEPSARPEHTPLPWRVGGHPRDSSGTNWREILTDSLPYAPSFIGSAQSEDAALIVSAVNNHALLVEALRGLLEAYAPNAQRSVDEANGDESILHSSVQRARAALATVAKESGR